MFKPQYALSFSTYILNALRIGPHFSAAGREEQPGLTEEITRKRSGSDRIRPQVLLRPVYIIGLLVLIILAAFLYSRTHHAVNTFTYTHMTMDTVVEIRFQAPGTRAAEEIRDAVFAEIERLERLFSRSVEDSDVVAVNKEAGRRPVTVSSEVFYVTEQALHFAELSGGAFDLTVAPLTDLWGFFSEYDYRVPAPGEIKATLEFVDYGLVVMDPDRQSIFLPVEGMGLELGGIAKGYIVDQALKILSEAGIQNAYINAGDIGLLGSRPDGEPWRIGVRNPRDKSDIIAVLPLTNRAVDTSGDYERAFEEGGVKYHHLLDPETGMPAMELASVTVVAETTMEADALSTAAFVLGLEKGMALIEGLAGVEGIFVTPQLEITVSSGLETIIELKQP